MEHPTERQEGPGRFRLGLERERDAQGGGRPPIMDDSEQTPALADRAGLSYRGSTLPQGAPAWTQGTTDHGSWRVASSG